jgi:hypothetical protein
MVVSFILGGSIDTGRCFVKKSVSPVEIRVFGRRKAMRFNHLKTSGD